MDLVHASVGRSSYFDEKSDCEDMSPLHCQRTNKRIGNSCYRSSLLDSLKMSKRCEDVAWEEQEGERCPFCTRYKKESAAARLAVRLSVKPDLYFTKRHKKVIKECSKG